MSHQPESLDVFASDLRDESIHDVLQIPIVFSRPDAARRERRCHNEAVLVDEVDKRKVVTLPVAIRPTAMQAENQRDLVTAFQVAG